MCHTYLYREDLYNAGDCWLYCWLYYMRLIAVIYIVRYIYISLVNIVWPCMDKLQLGLVELG